MRGYLWQNLSEEIAEEFDSFGSVDLDEAFSGRYYVGSLATWQSAARMEWLDEDKALPKDVLAALRAQRRVAFHKWHKENAPVGISLYERRKKERAALEASGKCRDCRGPKQHDNQRCDACRVRHSEYNKQLRAKKKQETEHMRIKLPADRTGVTQKFTLITRKLDADGAPLDGVQELKGYITASVYPQLDDNGQTHPMAGKLGEIFVKVGKPGASTALLDEWAVSLSRELQRGADPAELCRKHRFTHFEPSGQVRGIDGIKSCTSPTDLVTHWIERKFLGKVEE